MIRSWKIFNFVLIVCVLMSMTAYAADYTVDIHGTYRHPSTGVIEDSGGEEKEALGQSMVDRIMSQKAYYEEANGSNYLTFSLSLMNSISDLSFDLDTGGGFSPTSHERIFDGDDIADIRVKVASKDSILRAKCFVEPMGRNVVFYIYCSNFVTGNSTAYPSLVSHDTDEQAPVQVNSETVPNMEETSGLGFTENGINNNPEIASNMTDGESVPAVVAKDLPQANADSVIDSADGLYFGEDNKEEKGNKEEVSEKDIDEADIANSLMLDDSFWKTVFIFFITANLVSGIMLIAFYFAVKTVYDNRRYKKEKLRELFAQKEDNYREDEFMDDEFYELTYDDENSENDKLDGEDINVGSADETDTVKENEKSGENDGEKYND